MKLKPKVRMSIRDRSRADFRQFCSEGEVIIPYQAKVTPEVTVRVFIKLNPDQTWSFVDAD